MLCCPSLLHTNFALGYRTQCPAIQASSPHFFMPTTKPLEHRLQISETLDHLILYASVCLYVHCIGPQLFALKALLAAVKIQCNGAGFNHRMLCRQLTCRFTVFWNLPLQEAPRHANLIVATFACREIAAQVVTVMLAGYETTSVALTYCIYLLSKHPEAQQKLLEEVDGFQGKPGYEDLEKFPFASGVLNETLRVLPPAPLFARTAMEDVQVLLRNPCDLLVPHPIATE